MALLLIVGREAQAESAAQFPDVPGQAFPDRHYVDGGDDEAGATDLGLNSRPDVDPLDGGDLDALTPDRGPPTPDTGALSPDTGALSPDTGVRHPDAAPGDRDADDAAARPGTLPTADRESCQSTPSPAPWAVLLIAAALLARRAPPRPS